MTYKNDNILGKKVILLGTNIRQISSLEQVLLYAGADVRVFTDLSKGRQQIPSSQPDVIIFDDTDVADGAEVVKGIKADMTTTHTAWLVIHNSFDPEGYQEVFTNSNTVYLSKNVYDVAEVLKGLSILMKQLVPATNEIKLDLTNRVSIISQNQEVRVLIFEDDPLLQNILSMYLNRAKLSFIIFASGKNFKTQFEEYKPTVVLLDLTLEGINGLQVLEHIRQDPKFSNLPIVIFTNSADEEIMEKTAKLGVKDFLIKANTNFNDVVTLLVGRSNEQNVNKLSTQD